MNLNNVSLRISAGRPDQFPTDEMVQIAFSGRSNVGKSSLINLLLNRKSLARVSSAPGKTITINFYDVDKTFFLVDLPGYGFAKRSEEDKIKWSGLTEGYFTKNPHPELLTLVVQLVDSRIGATDDDRLMMNYMQSQHIPFIVVATKTDKLTKTEEKELEGKLRATGVPKDITIYPVSALKNQGRDALWNALSELTGAERR